MRSHKRPNVSSAEMEVLRLLWDMNEATVSELCAVLPSERNIAYSTVQTLLRRLESKGYVTHHKRGKAHVFQPATPKEDVVKRSVGEFVERVFGGDPIPLIHYLAEHGRLSEADINRLREVVKKKA